MQILAVFPQKEILDTVAFALESKCAARVQRANSEKDGLHIFSKDHTTLDLVIVDGGATMLTAFAALVKNSKSELPFIVCLKGEAKSQLKIEGLNVLGVADYTKLVADLLVYVSTVKPKVSARESGEGEEGKYCRIGTNLLIKVSPLDAGVFIRLSSTHFVQLFAKGDAFDVEDLKRYLQQKQVTYMYLYKTDTGAFLEKLNKELENLVNSDQVDLRAAGELVEETVDTIHELVNQIGVTPEVEQLVSNNVALSMKVMGDFPELQGLLERMHLERKEYIASHSMMVAHLACAIAVAMDWYSDQTFQKLTCAAFMHDVALRDHELCAVKSLQDLEKNFKGKFSLKETQEYKTHPQRGAMLAGQFKELGADVDKVILQHHEHPLGTGFPDALNSTHITPLAAVFIVAHDLVDYAFDHDGKVDIADYLTQNETKLQSGNFKKVLKGLAQMLPE